MSINDIITDGTVQYQVKEFVNNTDFDNEITTLNQNVSAIQTYINQFEGAAQHNGLYRGIDLTDYFNSGEMSTNIANGTFKNIYPGDYIIKSITVNGTTYSNVKWIVMDCDYHLHSGDTETTTHHVVLMPETNLGTAQMNTSNTTANGYQGSTMWKTTIPLVNTGITNAFGSAHVLTHRELLSNAMDANQKSKGYYGYSGASNDWSWANVTSNICNENQVYGAPILSSSFYDTGDCYNQFAAFRLSKSLQCKARTWFWLRAVAGSSGFCTAPHCGIAGNADASNALGVRPYFLLR